MHFQVIQFEGHDPIVTGSGRNEVTRFMQQKGLAYNHPHVVSYFLTLESANEFARNQDKPSEPKFEEVLPEVKEEVIEEAKPKRKKKDA